MFRFLSLLVLTLVHTSSYEAADLKVSVYYEVLCPDSIKFMKTQLLSTYRSIGDDLQVDLVPFGYAQMQQTDNGTYEFTCEHGADECYGNKYHSCVIAHGSVDQSVVFAHCSMSADSPASDQTLGQCSHEAGINWAILQNCYETGEADVLLAKNGDRTAALQPPLYWMPTVIFNDQFNQTLQDGATDDLLKVVCDLMDGQPDACSSF